MGWLTIDEVAAALGVKRATVYTYASRGWLQTQGQGRERRYAEPDVTHLQTRAAAVSGHAGAAARALDWGPPLLSSAITEIDADGPNYRGIPALTLAEKEVPFESVAVLLWEGQQPERVPVFPTCGSLVDEALSQWPDNAPVEASLMAALARLQATQTALDAPALVGTLARAAVSASHRQGLDIAAVLAADAGQSQTIGWVTQALVLCADHELNASTFAARVAASTGASLAAAVTAALAAWSGPLHGGGPAVLEAALASGSALPSSAFGHRLYPQGDPRGAYLVEVARAHAVDEAREAALLATDVPPNLDFGLVALSRALGWRTGTASRVFAVGRSAGWVAHAREQAAQGALMRPRAVFTG